MSDSEVDRLRAENEQLRAAIVAWNDYSEATDAHYFAQRRHEDAVSSDDKEARSFWADAVLTHSSEWLAALKRLEALGARRASPTWKY